MQYQVCYIFLAIGVFGCSQSSESVDRNNPIFEGWYADPEGVVFDDTYWVFPTFSDDYDKQLHFDAFSSKDLVNWEKHERILNTTKIKWLRQALWSPSIIEKEDKCYLFFGGSDIQRPGRKAISPPVPGIILSLKNRIPTNILWYITEDLFPTKTEITVSFPSIKWDSMTMTT